MHTIKLQVDDTVYDEIVKSDINIQEELKLALGNIVFRKSYLDSPQYQEDKKYFNDALDEIESGVELSSHEDVWNKIEKHTK